MQLVSDLRFLPLFALTPIFLGDEGAEVHGGRGGRVLPSFAIASAVAKRMGKCFKSHTCSSCPESSKTLFAKIKEGS